MLKEIVAYVNFRLPAVKSQFYNDNYIKACLVHEFLYANYFNQKIDFFKVIYDLSGYRYSLLSKSNILSNHLIFNLGFRSFWDIYKVGRGNVYIFDTRFQENEVLGYLTGILYWLFNSGVTRD